MGTGIVIGVLIIIVCLAAGSSVRHFKGEGGCCGGGDSVPKAKKQKLKQVAAVKRMKIEGMKCDQCRKNIENGLNSLNQVNAKVDLKKKEAVIKLGEPVSDEVLAAAVEGLGYQVVSIENA